MPHTLKQTDVNRVLNAVLRNEATARGWKSIGGILYWKDTNLFFMLLVVAVARKRTLYFSLRTKWFRLDDHLWTILGMASNTRQRASLRANGAFTLAGQEILDDLLPDCDWSAEWLGHKVNTVATSAAAKAREVLGAGANIDDYLAFMERQHAALVARYPNAVVNIWVERVLVAIEKGDRRTAADIAAARLAAQDLGTFVVDGRTFYERALDYLAGAA